MLIPLRQKDMLSGFFVFLIALPLSMGVAMASGFPPISGIFTACIGGCLASLLGGSRLTIKGPAAGLIVIVLGAVQELSMGDPFAGYRKTLAVGVAAALVQILFAIARLGIFAEMMPLAVAHGMLSAIGVIIISKQIHLLCGVTPTASHPVDLLLEIPHSLQTLNPQVFFIGALSLALLFLLPKLKIPTIKKIPAPIFALGAAIPLAFYLGFDTQHEYLFMGQAHMVGPKLLVNLPANFVQAITFPDFSSLFSFVSLKYVFLLAIVGMIESLLTVSAVDALDPKRIPSDLNRDLLAVGISNLVAAFIGGLPMISEIVRSKANIDNGAESAGANFFHGVCLFLAISIFPTLLHYIPLAVLAAMLVYTGSRLASPSEFVLTFQKGYDQFAIFFLTLITTICTDLLLGIVVGLAGKFLLHRLWGVPFLHPFRVQTTTIREGDKQVMKIESPCTFTNYIPLKRKIITARKESDIVELNFYASRLIDYTTQSKLRELQREFGSVHLTIKGFENHRSVSPDPLSTKIRMQ